MVPIATTIIISFKEQADITRKPPVIFPCDTPTSSFDLSECRWAVEGYQRVLIPKPSETSLIGIELTAPCGELVETALDRGFLINVTANNTIRLLPPLIMSDSQAEELAAGVVALIREFHP